MTTAPKSLGAAGRALWQELTDAYTMDGTTPLLVELCTLADRLADVRQAMKRDGVVLASGKANPLLAAELKLQVTYQKCWRLLGLADPDPAEKRGPGRPPGR